MERFLFNRSTFLLNKKLAHAIIKIHSIEVFLNVALKFLNDTFGINYGDHLIITFNSVDELLNSLLEVIWTEAV